VTRREKILVKKALAELHKIFKAVSAIQEEAGEDMGYTSDMLDPIDCACGAATEALQQLPGVKT
jgi:hypothetical protein